MPYYISGHHAKKAKTYHIKPLKIFSYRDAIYLHARLAREPGKAYQEPDFDPLLAIHRLKKVEITDRGYEYPADYNFEDVFDKNFGFIKDDCFEVEVEFTGWAAQYVAERIWSTDQKITNINDDKVHLLFSASSDVELIAWILSFGEEARMIQPEWVVEKILHKVKMTEALYKRVTSYNKSKHENLDESNHSQSGNGDNLCPKTISIEGK